MKILEYLEQDREKFLAELAEKRTPENAIPVIIAEVDRLLYRYNAECEEDELRECAAGMAEAVKAVCALTDSVKEIKVWERTLPAAYGRKKESLLPMAAAGCGSMAVGVLLAVFLHPFGIILSSILPSVAFIAGAVLLFLTGRKLGQGKAVPEKRETERHTESILDEDRVYRYLRASVMVMDRRLDELAGELRFREAENGAEGEGDLSDTQVALYSDLLEALYSEDGEFALERLKNLTYYLHSLGIELEEYSEKNEEFFDRMPGAGTLTIRPALVRGGILLKKGLAIAG